MVHLASSIALGATGSINGGLITAQVLDKLHMSGSPAGLALSALGGFVCGLALIAGYRAMVSVLADASNEQII